jgi:hypothetical protein
VLRHDKKEKRAEERERGEYGSVNEASLSLVSFYVCLFVGVRFE